MQELLDSVKSLSSKERKALAVLLKRQGINLYGVVPISLRTPGELLLPSYAQQRQWFLWQLEPESAAYNMPAALRLRGELDIEALRSSFDALIARHETLRTTFRQDGEQAVQVIHPRIDLVWGQEALEAADEELIQSKVEEEIAKPFDLEQGPLLRVKLLRLAESDHVLILTLHHIVSDGWSMPIMVDELVRLYEGYCTGQETSLPELPIQYADYAIWQRQWMEAGEQERQLAYWKAQLGEEQPVLELPTDHPRPAIQSQKGAGLSIELSDALAQSLKQLAQQQGVTLFMLLLASFQTLLHRYSGQDDIRVGVPIANRNRVETERLIGFFVNTQVLKAEFDLQMTFSELLKQVQQTALAAQAHQDLPFEQLVEALHPERSLSHSPLFQVMYNHQSQVRGESRHLPGLEVEGLILEGHTAKFDLTLDTFEHEQGIGASLSYATALFDKPSIERMAGHWLNLLESIVEAPQQRIAELPLLGEEEYRQVVYDWNRTEASYPSEQCVHQLIEVQAEKTPDAVAVVFGDQELTYQQLNRRSNQLAHKLRELGIGPDVLVGIAVERSLDMVIGLLAILKAGGAYVPLDPEYPQERLAYMMEHSGAKLLLTQKSLVGYIPTSKAMTWCLDSDWQEISHYPETAISPTSDSESLAYCIYTSGSTGKPKGVTVRHRALVNFLVSMAKRPGLGAGDRVLALTSLSFDIAALELYLPLIIGASLVMLADQENRDPQALLALIGRQSVNTIQATPSTWRMLLDAAPVDAFQNCRLISGGEALPVDLAAQLLQRVDRLWNLYGPTETTIWSGAYCLDAEHLLPLLGKPIANTSMHLLGVGFEPLPIGVVGELLIGGEGLARGYHLRPSLTAERFIPDPFDSSTQGGGRLYRTGDLARYRSDGVIEYVGRIDHQVKIRGFRIELGEIEARLQGHAAVREAVVVDIEGPSGKQLAAYLVTDIEPEQQAILRTSLRDHLKEALPDYMVPAHLIFLETMPLTPNGKLDRKALPKPDASQLQQEYVAPQSELEQQIAAIWADVLKVERVGLTDNFFELGGHSLLATQVTSRIRQALQIELPLRTLFEAPVLADFAAHTGQGAASAVLAFERVDRSQPLALSYAQQRQWFLWQLEPESAAYNMPAALRLRGELDIEALRSSFDALIARHETLRTTFRQDGEQAVQVIHPRIDLVWGQEALEAADEELIQSKVEEEIARPFDLEQGPLLRVKLLRLSESDHVLILTLHHIVSDGWSMPIMVDELVRLYEGYCTGQETSLPELPIQYADYAIWQRQWMEAGEQERQLAYWKAQLGEEQPVLELPTDHPRPAIQSQEGAGLSIELSDALAQSLKQLAQQQGVTLFMLLLASFQTLLHRYSGQDDIRVGAPIANRNRVETERLIGFFVNTQVLKAEFDLQMTFSELLKQVQQTALAAQAHQDLPFEQLVEALHPERSLSHSPLFQVMYNHQSQVRGESRHLPGLEVEGLILEGHTAKFDLTLDTFEHEQGIGASLSYATALFDKPSIERMAGHWLNLLEGIVEAPQQRIAELPLLGEEEYRQVVYDWNRTEASYPSEQCVHQLIEVQAEKTPDAVAVVFGDQELTYQQLNRRSNQLAHKLRELGIGPDVLVGIAVERSLDMVIGLLAILKAGGAYVPLDPEYPQERLAYMMEDSGIRLLLTQVHLQDQLPIPGHVQSLSLDSGKDWLKGCSESNPINITHPENLAYVIYTSGSTGRPKGTLLPHFNVMRLFQATQDWYRFDANDVWSVFHSYAFDFSVWELFGALLHGAKAVVVPQEIARSPEDFHALLAREKVTVLNQTPSAFKQLIPVAIEKTRFLSLRYVIFGGEALDVGSLEPWIRVFGDSQPQLINMYGITETTVHVTYRPIRGTDLGKEVVSPIGEVITDLSWYLLDGNHGVAIPGCHGELHVGRAGLARGYHQRPALTAERFIPDPFDSSTQGGGRLYRTGDLARYRSDGVIEYVGRIDHQVKIRGFRIELGEIEARLQGHAAVREAVVVDIEGPSGKQLAAYLVTDIEPEQQAVLRTSLRDHLKEALPDYMVPAHLIFLEAMPLTPNGKLDRKALPKPDASQLQQEYVAPQSELEQQIAAIWADILKVKVGLTDNFFELGGDSIISIQVVSRARQAGIHFTPRELFQHQTVQSLASVAKRGEEVSFQINQEAVTGEASLLPIQRYFFEAELPEHHHWNQALLLQPGKALNAEHLEQAIQALIVHHDALRLSFIQDVNSVWMAHYRPVIEQQSILWQLSAQNEAELEALCTKAQGSLSLQEGPLVRAVLVTLSDGSQRLLLAIHHLVVDGVSWRILLEDLQTIYAQLQAKQPIDLPAKTSSTKAWVEHLQTYANNEVQRQELGYWKAQLTDVHANLPCDDPEGSLQGCYAASAQTLLDQNYTRQLLQHAPMAYRTQVNDLLLTALARVITRWIQSDDVLLQLEGHGREDLFDNIDLTRTVGWFTSIFPVKLSPEQTLERSIKRIKEQLRAIPAKGIGFGILRYLGDKQAKQTLSALPLPRITFNYLGQFDSSFASEWAEEEGEAALFMPASESSGASQSEQAPLSNWLSINGQVYGGELSLTWSFSRKMFKEETIQRLAHEYAEELKLVIDHCTSDEAGGLTPSDLIGVDMDQHALDSLLDEIL